MWTVCDDVGEGGGVMLTAEESHILEETRTELRQIRQGHSGSLNMYYAPVNEAVEKLCKKAMYRGVWTGTWEFENKLLSIGSEFVCFLGDLK